MISYRRNHKNNARWHLIRRQKRNKGLGFLHGTVRTLPDCNQRPRILSTNKFWERDDEMQDSFVVVKLVKLPTAMIKAPLPTLALYLLDYGIIDHTHCTHDYDCCGCFYPMGSGEVIKRKGRTITVTQSWDRNI